MNGSMVSGGPARVSSWPEAGLSNHLHGGSGRRVNTQCCIHYMTYSIQYITDNTSSILYEAQCTYNLKNNKHII